MYDISHINNTERIMRKRIKITFESENKGKYEKISQEEISKTNQTIKENMKNENKPISGKKICECLLCKKKRTKKEVFNDAAKRHITTWDINQFTKSHPKLFNAIMEAMDNYKQ
jgi:hypothetical protein